MSSSVPNQAEIIAQLASPFRFATTNVTYGFPEEMANITSEMSAVQQAVMKFAIGLWDDLIDISFTYEANASDANIWFGNREGEATSSSATAFVDRRLNDFYAWTGIGAPQYDYVAFGKNTDFKFTNLDDALSDAIGIRDYLHEFGHVMGLKHAGNYNEEIYLWNSPSSYQDSSVYSVMSYYGPDWFKGEGVVAWGKWKNQYPQTPMVNDIIAIQSMYGHAATRIGDDTYGFNSTFSGDYKSLFDFGKNVKPVLTIYDTGGINTLDLSGYTSKNVVNLNENSYSSVGGLENNLGIAQYTTIHRFVGGSGADEVFGNSANNYLEGGDGNDILDGWFGFDTMVGGLNDDIYYIDNPEDVVLEFSNEGIDTIHSEISYVLGSNVENLTLDGYAKQGTGNELSNTITGNDEHNSLFGMAGDDILDGGTFNDTLVGGSGSDTIIGGIGNDIAVFEGYGSAMPDRSHFTLSNFAGYLNVLDQETNDIDHLTGIEGIHFSNDSETVEWFGVAPDSLKYLALMDGDDVFVGGFTTDAAVDGGDEGSGGGDTLTIHDAATIVVSAFDVGVKSKFGDFQDNVTASTAVHVKNGGLYATNFEIVDGSFSNVEFDLDDIDPTSINTPLFRSDEGAVADFSGTTRTIDFAVSIETVVASLDGTTVSLEGFSKLVGGAGADTINLSGITNDPSPGDPADTKKFVVNLTTGHLNANGISIILDSIETIIGSGFADSYVGLSTDDYADLAAGKDKATTTGGHDAVLGGLGSDELDLNLLDGQESAGVDVMLSSYADANRASYGFQRAVSNGGMLVAASVGGSKTYAAEFETVVGSAGDDHFNVKSGFSGSYVLDGGAGENVLSFSGNSAGLALAVNGGSINYGSAALTLLHFDSVEATNVRDVMTVVGGMHLDALAGDDFIYGSSGNDNFDLGAGADTTYLYAGNDTVRFTADVTDTINKVGGGTLTLDMSELLFNFSLTYNASSKGWYRTDGRILVSSGGLSPISLAVIGSDWNDSITIGTFGGWFKADLGYGNDNYYGGVGNETVHGGGNADYISGNSGDDMLYGDDGDDMLQGGIGNDTLDFGTGNNTLLIGDNYANSYAVSGHYIVTVVDLEHMVLKEWNNDANFASNLAQTWTDTLVGNVKTVNGATQAFGSNNAENLLNVTYVEAGGGADYIENAKASTAFGGDGNDTFNGGATTLPIVTSTFHGDDGIDTFTLSNDIAYGDDGDDVFHGTGTVYGGRGNDTFDIGYSTVSYLDGVTDHIVFNGLAKTVTQYAGGTFTDSFTTVQGTLVATNNADTFESGGGGIMSALGGNDVFTNIAGTLYGGADDDTFYMNQYLTDTFGDGDDDTFYITAGRKAEGGAGHDTFWLYGATAVTGGTGTADDGVSDDFYIVARGGAVAKVVNSIQSSDHVHIDMDFATDMNDLMSKATISGGRCYFKSGAEEVTLNFASGTVVGFHAELSRLGA